MKYMGSKAAMLQRGLGDLLLEEAKRHERFVDLFSGSGAVAWHVAEHSDVPVVAADLQHYSAVLARAVIGRTRRVDASRLARQWLEPAVALAEQSPEWSDACELVAKGVTRSVVKRCRSLCARPTLVTPVWTAYGGYYFSPSQALAFDALIAALPQREPDRSVCLAAVLMGAMRCAAAPGHTAQPFQPTPTALPFIADAWSVAPFAIVNSALRSLAPRHALQRGSTMVEDAVVATSYLRQDDLVFLDPPYSAVHYSRFYHVLETMALGKVSPVSGAGRYPPTSERPRSSFSVVSEARPQFEILLSKLADVGCSVVITFPLAKASNGLSGVMIEEIARQRFVIDSHVVVGRFSTLGGNNVGRESRRPSAELVLTLAPKQSAMARRPRTTAFFAAAGSRDARSRA